MFFLTQGLPRLTRFLETVVSYLPDWRKSLNSFPAVAWHHFIDHIRTNINPLAADDHMKEVIQQLQLMGEVKRPMGIYHFVDGSTGTGYSLLCFDLQGKKWSWLKRHIFHLG